MQRGCGAGHLDVLRELFPDMMAHGYLKPVSWKERTVARTFLGLAMVSIAFNQAMVNRARMPTVTVFTLGLTQFTFACRKSFCFAVWTFRHFFSFDS